MNNGKVRIYELSKELNLENKEIIEICETLNISVKSHSSTITEEQAERIRATAPTPGAPTPPQPPKPQGKKPKKNVKHKQEILEIRHSSDNPSEKTPSDRLSSPPSRSDHGAMVEKTDATPNDSGLLRPPSRPSRPKPPVLKRKGKKDAEPVAPEATGGDRPGENSSIEVKTEIRVNRPKQREEGEEKKEAAKPMPKLQAPPQRPTKAKPPAKIESTVSNDLDDDDDDDSIDAETLLEKPVRPQIKLKRPHSKRKDTWENEEEDDGTNKKKPPVKGKRRPKPLLEEDDDFESDLNQSVETKTNTMSIARPPKPKSMQGKVTAKKTPPKKAIAKPTKNSRSDRREQRKARAEVVRPEFIVLSENLTVRELSEQIEVSETEIIKSMFMKGIAINVTQTLDVDIATSIAEEFGVEVITEEEKSAAEKSTEMVEASDLDSLQHRPPVVTIMGHVDHGKTTLLDSIRKTKVAQGEAGGITQHVGAYHVDVEHNGKEQQIVFLDTPGHEAFTAMRARGARVTDIAILVVAADDGVRPQTIEAISHAKAAGVPLVVAINKMDKEEAQPDRVKQELAEHQLVPEDWGGDTIMVPVSALSGENLDTLLEMILLVSEIEELSANPNRTAKGTVIEAHLDRARGAVASLLVQNGTLRVGDCIVAGSIFGKIRAMVDDRGNTVEAATPSFAVEVLGLSGVPEAGDEFDVLENEKEARALADERQQKRRNTRLQQSLGSRRVTLSSISAQAQEGELKELNLIVKSDVQGSVEAILGSLQQLPQDEVQIRVLMSAPGEISETDVDLAAASGAIIIGFNTTLASGARAAADREGVDIREYNIIYNLLDEIRGAMEGLLDPEEVEEFLGQAEVRAVFPAGRGAVAGCYVQQGKLVRNRLVRVRRNNNVVYQGSLDSLRRIKEDVREVNSGYECGLGIDKFNSWEEGDIIEAYQMVFKMRTLSGSK